MAGKGCVMPNEKIKEIIGRLLNEIEEEDIGISLFLSCYQDKDELEFFKDQDRETIRKILKRAAEDSQRHKEMIVKIISKLGARRLEK